MENLSRTQLVLKDKLGKIQKAKILLLGVGGVGGFIFEMLVRLGVQQITVVDFDRFDESNLNRQILATSNTLGEIKVEVAKNRAAEINKNCKVISQNIKISQENLDSILNESFDYVIDAIDEVRAKVAVIIYCSTHNIPLISSMGTGNRYKMPNFIIEDLSKSSYDPLARKIRQELKKLNFKGKVNIAYTKEQVEKTDGLGSVVYYPLMCAGVIVSFVVNEIIKDNKKDL